MTREEAVKAIKSHCYFANLVPVGKEALDMAIKALEQQPKTGHWKLVQVGKRVDLCCANCGAVRVEEIAYNYTIDQLNKFFKEDYKEFLKMPDMSYCPCCGVKMENEE